MNIVEAIILPDLKLLENGIFLEISGLRQEFIGSLYCVYGDHMGQIALEGIIGPSGKYPSRFTLTPRNELSNLNYVPLPRNPTQTYLLLTDALSKLQIHSQKTMAASLLTNNGLLPKKVRIFNYLLLNFSVSFMGINSFF